MRCRRTESIVPIGPVQSFVLVKVESIGNTIDIVRRIRRIIGLSMHIAVEHLVLDRYRPGWVALSL